MVKQQSDFFPLREERLNTREYQRISNQNINKHRACIRLYQIVSDYTTHFFLKCGSDQFFNGQISEKPFPIQRLLIPLLPPFLLTFVFSFENQFNLYSKFVNYLSVIFSIFLSLNLFLNLENKSKINWVVGINKELLTCKEEALTDMRLRMAEYYRLLNKKHLTTICK